MSSQRKRWRAVKKFGGWGVCCGDHCAITCHAYIYNVYICNVYIYIYIYIYIYDIILLYSYSHLLRGCFYWKFLHALFSFSTLHRSSFLIKQDNFLTFNINKLFSELAYPLENIKEKKIMI